MAALFRHRFPLSVSSARAIRRCRGTVAMIIGRLITAGPVAVEWPSDFFGVGVTPGPSLGLMGERDPSMSGHTGRIAGELSLPRSRTLTPPPLLQSPPEPTVARTSTADRGTPAPAPSWGSKTPPTRSSAPGCRCHAPPARRVRLLTVHRYGHTAFLTPEYQRRELHDPLLPHWCPPAEGPRARGMKSMGCAAQ
jgi:hypothetical protein